LCGWTEWVFFGHPGVGIAWPDELHQLLLRPKDLGSFNILDELRGIVHAKHRQVEACYRKFASKVKLIRTVSKLEKKNEPAVVMLIFVNASMDMDLVD